MVSAPLSAQERTIKGNVKTESGEPIPGVNIIEKDVYHGTITDKEGNFSISLSGDDAEIVVSSIGYKNQTIQVGQQTQLEIILKPDYMELDEVVVTGYGYQKKINLSGAVENVEIKDLDTRTVTNAGLALQGKVSGVNVIQTSGQPGHDGTEIRIRGVSSIENNNEPLVIIDGMEGSLNDVNPRNIQSMSVLKDASSAAIYGNRAAAGVIIIETKEGSAGEVNVNFSSTFSNQRATIIPTSVDPYTYGSLLNEARLNVGFPTGMYDSTQLELMKNEEFPYTPLDMYGTYFNNTNLMKNYYATVSAGSDNYTFAFSAGHMNQDGVLYGTSADKFTYRSKLNAKFLNNRIRLGMSFSGYESNDRELTTSTSSLLTQMATKSPYGFVSRTDSITGVTRYSTKFQPYAMTAEGGGSFRERSSFTYRLNAEIDFVKGLTGKISYGENRYPYKYTRLVPQVAFAVSDPTLDEVGYVSQSRLTKTWSNTNRSTFNSILTYRLKVQEHDINFLGGYEYITYDYISDNADAKYLLANNPSYDLSDPETYDLGSRIRSSATMSYFTRFSYIFKDRYIFESNFRADASSRFTKGNRWGLFPSFSVAWRISEEAFMESFDFLYLKLRGSWGQLGNERIRSYYPAYGQLSPGYYYDFNDVIYQGTAITLLPNNNISWENTEQLNIGFDANLFDNYSLSFNYFSKVTSDILGQMDIPFSLGLGDSKPYQNIGIMKNEGVEATLNYQNQWNNWRISSTLNFTYLNNEVIDLGGLEYIANNDVVSGYSPPSSIIRSKVGEPYGSYYGYIADGIYQVSDFIWQDDSDPSIDYYEREYELKPDVVDASAIVGRLRPGDIKFKDIDSPDGAGPDGRITTDDITNIGNSQPKYIFSGNLNFGYKNIYLDVLMQGSYGNKAYMMGAPVTPFWGGRGNITQELADNRWTYENPSKTHTRVYDDSQRANIVSSYYINDASYLRIKNVELGYNFNHSLLDKIGIGELKCFITVENAFTFTKMKNFDPEKPINRVTADFHPQIRIYSFGLNVTL